MTRLRGSPPRNIEVVKICARIEEELQGLSDEEQREMLGAYGIEESGLLRVIHSGTRRSACQLLLTAGGSARAWTIQDGWKAPQAAGVIHTDFERGFSVPKSSASTIASSTRPKLPAAPPESSAPKARVCRQRRRRDALLFNV